MANTSGKAYGLTVLTPIKNGLINGMEYVGLTQRVINSLGLGEHSPFAKVPNTYLARFYILNDVFFENYPAKEDHLKSKYLGFSTNFYGDLDEYLRGMWNNAEEDIKNIWAHCVVFEKVNNASDFISYIKKCQINNSLFFNGSTDDPLDDQLKALYIKQEFSQFATDHQGLPAKELQAAFQAFLVKVQPNNLAGPTWKPGVEYGGK